MLSGGAVIFLEGTAHDVDALLKAGARAVKPDLLGVETELEVFLHAGARLTALTVEVGEAEPFGLFDATAKALAKKWKVRTWALTMFAGTEEWMRATAFDARGTRRWTEESSDVLDAKTAAPVRRLVKRFAPRDFPYWRFVSELKHRPRTKLLDLGIAPVLQLGDVRGWKRAGRRWLGFSEAKQAELAAEAKALLEARAARALELHAEREQFMREETARAAARLEEAEREAQTFMSRALVPGEAREVLLPEVQHRAAQKLATRYGVDVAWVFQAAAAQATPWKFPPSALGAVPLNKPKPAVLVVSSELEKALAASTLSRPDGTTGTFDELVRVAVSVGLDALKEALAEEAQRRRKRP